MEYKECFTEHKSLQTQRHLKEATKLVYTCTLIVVYHIFVFLLGIVMAFVGGIINAINVFCHVWVCGPALKLFILWTYTCASVIIAPIRAIYRPLVDASARVFRQIRIDGKWSGSSVEKLTGPRGQSQPGERLDV